MISLFRISPSAFRFPFVLGLMLGSWAAIVVPLASAQQGKDYVLRIGATSTLTGKADDPKEKTGQELLHRFIKDETGLNNEVAGQEKWESLAEKMAKGETHLGVFQGYEFAWAEQKHTRLKPLALGVNIYTYPVVCILVKRNNPAADLSGLKGQSLAMPVTAQGFSNLFLSRQVGAGGKLPGPFFSKIVPAENVEDALDDLVDGKYQSVVVEQAASDAFKRRKPGRFKQLKEVARSQPFPPTVVAYYGGNLDPATLQRFKSCLLSASTKEKGELLLTLGHLTGFVDVPSGLEEVLAKTRKSYPFDGPK